METLILESNINICNDLIRTVEKACHECVGVASNYHDALALLAEGKKFELVVINTHLPPYAGFDIASELADSNSKLKFIFYVTGQPRRLELNIASQFIQTCAIVSGLDEEFSAALDSISQPSAKSLFCSKTVRPFFRDEHGQRCFDKNGRPVVWMVERLRTLTALRFRTLIQHAQGLSNKEIAKLNGCTHKAVSGMLSAICKHLLLPTSELQNFVYAEGLMNPLPYDAHCAYCAGCSRSTFLSSREVEAAMSNQWVTVNCSKCKTSWEASLTEIRRIADDENQAEDAA